MHAAPALSVAMIVRDEAALLPGCLDSLAPLAAEICIVDTGSTDDTPVIAKRHGCIVAHAEWSGDFAAARNASLRLCTAPWIFVIDADERLAPADAPRLLDLARGPRDCCYRFVTRNYTNARHLSGFTPCNDADPLTHGFAGWFPSVKVRLFPNGTGAVFERPVHELINEPLERRGLQVRLAEIPIHHYPLLQSADRLARKRALYIDLGEAKARAAPNDPGAHAELAEQYIEAGRYSDAVAAYQAAVRVAPENPAMLQGLGAALSLARRPAEALRAMELALRIDPRRADAWRNVGVIHANAGAWDNAITAFRRALEIAPEDPELRRSLAVALEGADRARNQHDSA